MDKTTLIILIVAGVVLFLLLGGVIFSVIYTMPIAEKLYQKQWVRQDEKKFERGCSDKSFDYHLDMFNKGMEFHDANLKKISEHQITSVDGLKLVAEYYDFGFDKTIIVLPGRTETCYYGAFYAEAFIKGGYNILCPDPRAHGLSQGTKITLGKMEASDAIEWAKYLHDKLGNKHIGLYGLCGGATASCIALTTPDVPSYIDLFIADGMFYSFFKVYKRHIVDEKHPVYPVIWEIMHKIKKGNNCNPYGAAPHKLIKKIDCALLILTGEKDIFAVSKEAFKMYETCPSKDKSIALIKNARHSHLRYDNRVEYDKAVVDFLKAH
jgi:pimeloyl-ACP methyl ester carboxylesterase